MAVAGAGGDKNGYYGGVKAFLDQGISVWGDQLSPHQA